MVRGPSCKCNTHPTAFQVLERISKLLLEANTRDLAIRRDAGTEHSRVLCEVAATKHGRERPVCSPKGILELRSGAGVLGAKPLGSAHYQAQHAGALGGADMHAVGTGRQPFSVQGDGLGRGGVRLQHFAAAGIHHRDVQGVRA